MQIYTKKTVLEAALDRVRYLFDEFPNVVVQFSGGKDSTAILNIALKVAEEKNRLPLRVMFIDQELEWQTVVDHIREVMSDPRIDPWWLQIPFLIENATSTRENFLLTWDPDRKNVWVRPQEPNSVKVNKFGAKYWNDLFPKIPAVEYPGQKMCFLGGVRCEESPTRRVCLTHAATYKHITFGRKLDSAGLHFTFYPLYDWSLTDVWKFIHDNKIPYCGLYDEMFKQGVALNKMRVSNLNHETAVHALFFLQEVEPTTWNLITRRLNGIAMAGQMKKEAFNAPKELPWMFSSWREYRDYLLDKLIDKSDAERVEKFRQKFARMDRMYAKYPNQDQMVKVHIAAILCNDWLMNKITAWENKKERCLFRKSQRLENQDK
jgi:predicted phosphoadenosine phosphosulfate sulfurtransferase